MLAAGWPWASGGIVSTAGDLNRFIRGYVGKKIFGADVQAEQFELIAGGRSVPPGPGRNSAGLGIFRYQTRCGTVYGHTGNIFGYAQLIAASADGTRSLTVSVNAQLSEDVQPATFKVLRRAEVLAVCAALA